MLVVDVVLTFPGVDVLLFVVLGGGASEALDDELVLIFTIADICCTACWC